MVIERRWLKASEAARYVGVHTKTIYRACRARQIPYVKVPGIGVRIDRHGLDQLLTSKVSDRK